MRAEGFTEHAALMHEGTSHGPEQGAEPTQTRGGGTSREASERNPAGPREANVTQQMRLGGDLCSTQGGEAKDPKHLIITSSLLSRSGEMKARLRLLSFNILGLLPKFCLKHALFFDEVKPNFCFLKLYLQYKYKPSHLNNFSVKFLTEK